MPRPSPVSLAPRERIVWGGLAPHAIPALNDPIFERASSVDWLDDREAVLVLQFEGEPRAYPVQVPLWHEIANDDLDGRPVSDGLRGHGLCGDLRTTSPAKQPAPTVRTVLQCGCLAPQRLDGTALGALVAALAGFRPAPSHQSSPPSSTDDVARIPSYTCPARA
jgi:hypothetical protein